MWARQATAVAALVAAVAGCAGDGSAGRSPSTAPSGDATPVGVTRAAATTTGTVVWYDRANRIGVIAPDNATGELTVHGREIMIDGFKALHEGQRVQFTARDGEALRVLALEE